jgi:hypothetical protein
MKSNYEEKVELTCSENGTTLPAEILDFKPAYMLVVSVNRQVKVYLKYNTSSKCYVGNVGSLEFRSSGPKEIVKIKGRY